jgi:hypothetical protein
MSGLNCKISSEPLQNIRWALRHAGYLVAFALIIFALNHFDRMANTASFEKAILIIGLLVNFLYFCAYILIAGVRWLFKFMAQKE